VCNIHIECSIPIEGSTKYFKHSMTLRYTRPFGFSYTTYSSLNIIHLFLKN